MSAGLGGSALFWFSFLLVGLGAEGFWGVMDGGVEVGGA